MNAEYTVTVVTQHYRGIVYISEGRQQQLEQALKSTALKSIG